jgi:AcrR family transcriptional regulator
MTESTGGSARARDVAALVDAATELFAARGPAATSLRDVAARAGVNYGLIHQYIGTKDDLLRLVVERVSRQTAERVAAGASVADVVADVVHGGASPYLQMVARALLDGQEPATLLERSPAMSTIIGRLMASAPAGTDPDDVAVEVIALMSLVMGWRLFGPFLMSAAGLGDRAVDDVADRLVAPARRVLTLDRPTG